MVGGAVAPSREVSVMTINMAATRGFAKSDFQLKQNVDKIKPFSGRLAS